MCLGKPFTAIYGGEGKTIIRTQIIVRGKEKDLIPNVFPKGNQHHWKLLKDFLDEVRKDIHKSEDGIEELKWLIRNAKEE